MANNALRANTTEAVLRDTGYDIIPDNVQYGIDLLSVGVFLLVASFGVFSNVLNMVVLIKSGVKDCVSICLLSLAVSDFGVTAMVLTYGILVVLIMGQWYFYVDPLSVLLLVSWDFSVFCDVTMFHTSFISLERCLCVLFPFHFKNLITPRRAVIAVVVMYIMGVLCYIPIFISNGFSVQFDPAYNTNRVMLWNADDRRFMEHLFNLYETMGMNFFNLATVMVCTVGMVIGLKRSAKFSSSNSNAKDSGMSKKKMDVVKMVSIVATVYIICTCARSAVIMPKFFNPELAPYRKLHNTYQTIVALYYVFAVVNSSVNIFIYYHYKPSFKDTLKTLLGCGTDNK